MAEELTPDTLERYFFWRRRQGHVSSLSPLSLRRLLGYLDGLGVLQPNDTVPSSVDRLLGAFRDNLLRERWMKASSAVAVWADRTRVVGEPGTACGWSGARVRRRGQHIRRRQVERVDIGVCRHTGVSDGSSRRVLDGPLCCRQAVQSHVFARTR